MFGEYLYEPQLCQANVPIAIATPIAHSLDLHQPPIYNCRHSKRKCVTCFFGILFNNLLLTKRIIPIVKMQRLKRQHSIHPYQIHKEFVAIRCSKCEHEPVTFDRLQPVDQMQLIHVMDAHPY